MKLVDLVNEKKLVSKMIITETQLKRLIDKMELGQDLTDKRKVIKKK